MIPKPPHDPELGLLVLLTVLVAVITALQIIDAIPGWR
jgi:hypothetical protein